MKSKLAILVWLFAITACVNVPIVDDIPKSEVVSRSGFSCKKPYELTRDCSPNSAATRALSINGRAIRVASTDTGDIVFVNGPTPWTDCLFRDIFVLNCPTHSKKSNESYGALRSYYDANGIGVTRVEALKVFGTIVGYYISLDTDGYSLLADLELSVDSNSDTEEL